VELHTQVGFWNHLVSKNIQRKTNAISAYMKIDKVWVPHSNDLQVEQLQLRLQQERSIRILLERAMGRASSTLSPGHRHFTAQVIWR